LLKFGGTVTLNTLVVHVAFNLDKFLLGRYWGAEVLGLYGRAYALIGFGSGALHSAVGPVVFATLSRMQEDPARNNAYFLQAYTLVNSATIPATLFCALFAEDLVGILLGPKWHDAAQIFRYLAPTVLVFGMITPFAWHLQSSGYQNRSLAMAFVIAILVTGAYVVGLPYGATGVGLAYSVAMSVWAIPHIAWSVHGTALSTWDVLAALSRPALSCAVAGAIAAGVTFVLPSHQFPILSFVIAGTTMAISYVAMLCLLVGRKSFYAEVLAGLRSSSPPGAVG
jgi:PST family polysaccharide transporter